MQHFLHLTQWVFLLGLGGFLQHWRGATKVADLTNACVVILWVSCSGPGGELSDPCGFLPTEDSLWLYDFISIFPNILSSEQHTFAWAKKMGPIQHFVIAWCYCLTTIYHRNVLVLSCKSFFFFLSFSTFCLRVCWDKIATHLPDFKHGRSKMQRNLDFMALWPTNSSKCYGTDLCEVCKTALTRRGRGFNLCYRIHKSPSRGWKLSSNSTVIKSTHYARLRKQQHWK